MRTALLLVLALAARTSAAEPDFAAGKAMIADYFRVQSAAISRDCLADLTTKADWEKRRPELRRKFFEMMGLWPLPIRNDLKPVVTGAAAGDGYRVEKLHFQSIPGLYVTANLYLPAGDVKQAPAVLYLCGHGNVVENGVSFGSKVYYRYHPAWFAANGYVCLVLDTLQLHEIPATHHGTYREKMWWWQARGYTPAGVELWNAIRALDYVQTRPEVDAKRIGVTGRSGGGATSWWVAAADERVRAVVPVAGFADLTAHLSDGAQPGTPDRLKLGVIAGHCDCMYPVNTYRWDFAQVAALIAPRPLLLGNSDRDEIFPVAGYRRIAEKVRIVYALYGADDRFQLLETKGPHEDTSALRAGINHWLSRWLERPEPPAGAERLPPLLKPQDLRVLGKPPEDAINTTIHESFVKAAAIEVPASKAVAREWWVSKREELLAGLRDKVFAGWPKSNPKLDPKPAGDETHDGVRLRAFDFVSEEAISLRLFVLTVGEGPPKRVVLSVLDETAWQTWCRDLGPAFAKPLLRTDAWTRDDAKFAQNAAVMKQGVAFAAVCPRGIGPTRWAADGSADDTHLRRRFPLLGQTLDGQRVWDVRRAVQAAGGVPDLRGLPLRLHGDREAAGLALYAGLFEPGVTEFDLWQMPTTHRDGPILLNVAKVLDLPQAVALATKPVTLHVKPADRAAWAWPLRLQEATGEKRLTVTDDAP